LTLVVLGLGALVYGIILRGGLVWPMVWLAATASYLLFRSAGQAGDARGGHPRDETGGRHAEPVSEPVSEPAPEYLPPEPAEPRVDAGQVPVLFIQSVEPGPSASLSGDSGIMADRRADLIRAGRLRVRSKLAPYPEPEPLPSPTVEPQAVPAFFPQPDPETAVAVAQTTTYQYGRPIKRQEVRLQLHVRWMPRR